MSQLIRYKGKIYKELETRQTFTDGHTIHELEDFIKDDISKNIDTWARDIKDFLVKKLLQEAQARKSMSVEDINSAFVNGVEEFISTIENTDIVRRA